MNQLIKSFVAVIFIMTVAGVLDVQACQLHDPGLVRKVMLNLKYPDAIHVEGSCGHYKRPAVWHCLI